MDHLLISFTFKKSSISFTAAQMKAHYTLDYKNMDLVGLCDYLLDFDFSPYLKSTEVESTWSSLTCVLTKSLDFFTPKKNMPGKKSPV